MSHTSPATYLVWSILSAVLLTFLLFHLWSFDRFQCLKWNSGAHSGAFKRIMTYAYLFSVPLICIYAVGNAVIKYHEGFIVHPTLGIIPKPSQLWEPWARATIFPFMLAFSIAWGLEMVTHLEELCFWLFLVNSGAGQQNWFHSLYFKTWVVGSVIAVTYMPLITILTRSDPLKSEAFTFLAGSLGSLSLTLWFTPILWTFPSFLNNLRFEGVDTATIVRLTKFSELNNIRIVFRFVFTVPLLILGIDGVRAHNHINESMLWTDFLAMIAAIGVAISSGITLVIFFPRSIEGEIATKDAAKNRKRTKSSGRGTSMGYVPGIDSTNHQLPQYQHNAVPSDTYLLTSSPVKQRFDRHSFDGEDQLEMAPAIYHHQDAPLEPARYHYQNTRDRQSRYEELDERRDVVGGEIPYKAKSHKPKPRQALTESNMSIHNTRMSNVNPMISNFTSPIDLAYGVRPPETRLAFNQQP